MWLFTKYGFFSIACADKQGSETLDPDTFMIRARSRQHLVNLQERFKDIELFQVPIIESREADYRYRLVVSKALWIQAVSALLEEQTWRNFKNEATAFEKLKKLSSGYVDSLHRIWEVMFQFQIDELPDRNDSKRV